jgi:hypothetical protein
LTDRAVELLAIQRAEEAEAGMREVLDRHQHPEHHTTLALSLLMQGKLREGFREFEARRSRRLLLERGMSITEWDGPLAGRPIVVFGEQGIGDELQASRFVPQLRAQGAKHITLACRHENVRALQQLGADVVLDRDAPTLAVPRDACWVAMWSLPHRLGLRLEDISNRSYLQASPSGIGGIGLVARGNPMNPNDVSRSMDASELQRAVPHGRLLEPAGDVLDSLGVVAGLDLLITVDTAWAHMAGALGVPCWLMLPYRNLDWRWLRERPDSPWYGSLRLYRQPAPGDWATVLSRIREDAVDGFFTRAALGSTAPKLAPRP